MAPNLKWYTSDGVTLVTAVTFTGVTPGTPSAAQTFRLVNDASGGAVDPATNPYIYLMERDPTTGEPMLQGLRGVDERWVTAELTGVSSTDVDQIASGIEPIGRGRVLRTATLPSAGWVQVKLRYNPPAGVPSGAASTREFVFGADDTPAYVVDQGHSESDRDGIIAGIGDGLYSELVVGGTITESGTPDAFVNIPDICWVHLGIPKVKLAHALELTNLDSAAAALVAGEAYWARLSVGAGATVTITKSVKFATPEDPDDIPDVPAGEIGIGWVLRTFDGTIENANITSQVWAGRFELTWTSGLNVTLGSGKARVDNALVVRQARSILALPANEALNYVWVMPDGTFDTTADGSKPDPRALLVWQVPTDATTVTIASKVDHRSYIGPVPVPVVLNFTGTLTTGLDAYGLWPFGKRGYIEPLRGMPFAWHTNGSGNAAGIVDVDLSVNGADVFPTATTRPHVEHDTSPARDTDALPEVLVVEPYSIFHAELDLSAEAFDGTPPSGATLTVLVTPT